MATLAAPTAPAVAHYGFWHTVAIHISADTPPNSGKNRHGAGGDQPGKCLPSPCSARSHDGTLSRRCARAEVDWPYNPGNTPGAQYMNASSSRPNGGYPSMNGGFYRESWFFVSRHRFFVSRRWFLVSRRWHFIPQHRFIKRFRISILRNTLHLCRRWYGLLWVQRTAEYFLREPLSLWGGQWPYPLNSPSRIIYLGFLLRSRLDCLFC